MDFPLSTPAEICRELGQRLRTHRLAQSLTQDHLAERAGVSLNAVRKLEMDGQTTMLTFVRICGVLGLTAGMEPLFQMQTSASIADMERAAAATRQRARRKAA